MSPDQHGYPTRAELRALREMAQPLRRRKDPVSADDLDTMFNRDGPTRVMEAIRAIWWMPDWGIRRETRRRRTFGGRRVRRWRVSTGGWSGNEDVIQTVEGTWWWTICWQQSNTGGHYVFDVPEPWT